MPSGFALPLQLRAVVSSQKWEYARLPTTSAMTELPSIESPRLATKMRAWAALCCFFLFSVGILYAIASRVVLRSTGEEESGDKGGF